MLYIVYSFFQEFIIPIIIVLFLGLVKIIKGNCLDKLCFYNYPVVKTKSDNNNNNNNNNIYINNYLWTCKTIFLILFLNGVSHYKIFR